MTLKDLFIDSLCGCVDFTIKTKDFFHQLKEDHQRMKEEFKAATGYDFSLANAHRAMIESNVGRKFSDEEWNALLDDPEGLWKVLQPKLDFDDKNT